MGAVLAELLGAGSEDVVEELAHAETSNRTRFFGRIGLRVVLSAIPCMTRQGCYGYDGDTRRIIFL